MFDTYELAVLAGLNFSSVFLALLILQIKDARKKRQVFKTIMEEMGEKFQLDQSFSDIIKKNFNEGRSDESR
jgi:uncharacterized protein (UPF0332 family)